MKHKKFWLRLGCLILLLSLLPVASVDALTKPSQAGERKLEGGQRNFKWPVPGQYNLSSCFLDNRAHYSIDIAGPMDSKVVASYAGTVIGTYTGCEHNWGKKDSCCSSWGNYVLLEHTYTLKSGKKITLYSRYAHLSKVSVSVGQSVAYGEKIGTVGSTGHSSGPHLDYEILYGGTSPSRIYSLDPYVNDLLELPEELHTTFGQCCQDYVAYVKQLYPRCTHQNYNSDGECTECGYVFDWKTTRDIDAMGKYTVSADTMAYGIPYAQTTGTRLKAGAVVSVNATVVNGLGKIWYEVAQEDGSSAYVSESTLKFQSYFESKIQLNGSTLKNGQVLKQESHRFDATVTSKYPLRSVTGYLDGKQYASWSGTGGVREITLRGTNLNKKLSFSELAPGQHNLVVYAKDSTGRDATIILDCTFEIKKSATNYTITFVNGDENTTLTVEDGQPLGEMAKPEQEGQTFLGWFTDEGVQVNGETVPTGDMTLTAKWDAIIYTVSFEGNIVEFAHGDTIEEIHNGIKPTHIFLGWYTEDGREILPGTPVLRDMVLYGHWEAKSYEITLDLAGGELDLKGNVSVTYGGHYDELYTPTREGYTFVGWALDGELITDETVVEKYEPHTITAVWQEVEQETSFWWAIPVVAVVLLGGAAVVTFLIQKKHSKEALF